MGADASIYSLIKPVVQQEGPLDQYTKSLQLKHLLGQGDLQALQLQQAQQSADSQAKLRDLFSRNPNATPDQVMGIDPKTGFQMRKDALEGDVKRASIGKDNAAAAKSQFEVHKEKLERGAALLANAKDQQSYDMVMTLGAQSGIFAPEFMQKAPRQFDPQWVSAMQNAGITRAQQLEQEHKAKTLAETGRHNLSTEANAAGQLKVSQGQLGVAQGNLGVSRERLNFDKQQPKGQYDAERGLLIDPRTGTATPVTQGGAPIGPKDKDAPEALLKASGYASRMQKAEEIMAKNADSGKPGLVEASAQKIPGVGNIAANLARDPARQQYNQAQEDWVRAKLRQESGAVIADEEMAREIRTYFPQIGDSPEVVAQKTAARQTASDAMVKAAGRAAPKQEPKQSPKSFNSMPDPKQYDGKSIRSDDGVIYKSNGKSWVRQMG